MTKLADCLPADRDDAVLIGRLALPEGPTPVLVREGRCLDISRFAATVSEALADADALKTAVGQDLGAIDDLGLAASFAEAASGAARMLAPVDLQCVKASGVTFAISAIERVIEERAQGHADRARDIRDALQARIGADIASVKPGSRSAADLKIALISDGLWSQYLEVAIGPEAEIFTKSPALSAVGWGDEVGVRSDSVWNNPEPEIALVCDGRGRPVGATLGNDVNLRDFEGRSALLLGKAKDNNASCALGPFIRLFDDAFSLDDVRKAEVSLAIEGRDGFTLTGQSSMSQISRDPLDLVGQVIGKHHQYPDGFALMLGTMFAPVADRDAPGQGFTHKVGDRVTVSTPTLGALVNEVTTCDQAPAWTLGIAGLMHNLAARGLLRGAA
ncbi:fumarylacetoacetate hydrolase family protein [Maricaulis sp.]|uniref:fumarylacetoacetate hydrolase family protein n=1 Tax=Maricaulis sp. TaxID=1486257 RepID=UPI00262ABBFB|nr:fumarylacetoacetate hydrolase family protein [Maricaulis sp.]MDF1768683.1 fumarylacetoacetate hydrolase family protein [Maricaulis sp.]